MAGFGTFVMLASTLVSFAGQMQAADAARKAGAMRQSAANEEAKQLEYVAGQARAQSQIRAGQERRRARYARSRLRALSAASGGGALTRTTEVLDLGLVEEGELRALYSVYEGEALAQGREAQARAVRLGGQAAYQAGLTRQQTGYYSAFGTGLSGVGQSLIDRYGPPERVGAGGGYGTGSRGRGGGVHGSYFDWI
jgi:hypothetical protein